MSNKHIYRLVHDTARASAKTMIDCAPDGYICTITEPKRTDEQNSKFHALCDDIAKSGMEWAGKKRTAAQWKVLLVSGHAVATKEGAEMVPGLEQEFVNLRESTALMSINRGSSLIEYTVAFCVMNNIRMNEYEQPI
jgi:hypothetical protein